MAYKPEQSILINLTTKQLEKLNESYVYYIAKYGVISRTAYVLLMLGL